MEMNEELLEDQVSLKQGLVKVMQCVAPSPPRPAVVNPSRVGGLADYPQWFCPRGHEDIRTLKREFGSVDGPGRSSRTEPQHTDADQKETLDGQYSRGRRTCRRQFRKFMEMVNARPEYRERKKDDFEESYANDLGDQNLHTLYDGVTGKPKLFSRPILEVYLKHSQGDRRVMERLCTRLTHLFCIGLIALMGYAAVIGDDEEGLSEEWAEKMQHVQDKMQEALRLCH
uniref:Rapunzel n=1 Tax=Neogobius melanostomus TaxID=47308 RepID=A0A8C6SGQ9_9GOBI